MNVLFYQLIKNALSGGSARFINLIFGLFMTPYLVLRLGPEQFGAWALISVLTGFVGLLDFSFKTSFVKFTAEAYARNDIRAASSILSTGFFFYTGFALTLSIVFYSNINFLLALLNIPSFLFQEVGRAFLLGLGGFLFTLVFSILPAACDARQRMDITNILGLIASILGVLLTILAVESGYGLPGVALAQLIGIVLFHLSCYITIRYFFGPLGLSLGKVSLDWIKILFPYSLKLHISTICDITNRQLDKLLISRWTHLSFVTSYELGLRMAVSAGSFQPVLSAGLLPASSHLTALGNHSQLKALYSESSRYLFLVGLPPYLFLGIHAHSVLVAWLGIPNPNAAAVLILLTIGYMVNSLSNGMAFICQGMGRPDIQMKQSALQLSINVILSLIFIFNFGPLGAPAGTSLALLIGAFYFALRFHRVLNLPLGSFLRKTAGPPFLAALIAGFCSWALTFWIADSYRAGALVKLSCGLMVFLPVYIFLGWRFKFIRPDDLNRIRSFWKEMIQRTGLK